MTHNFLLLQIFLYLVLYWKLTCQWAFFLHFTIMFLIITIMFLPFKTITPLFFNRSVHSILSCHMHQRWKDNGEATSSSSYVQLSSVTSWSKELSSLIGQSDQGDYIPVNSSIFYVKHLCLGMNWFNGIFQSHIGLAWVL